MTNLKDARENGLEHFISEQELALGQKGDLDRLNQLIASPYQDKSKEAQEASLPDPDGDCSDTRTP